MKPIQLRIAATLALLALAPVVGHGYVTYTWKGGDGNWSDPDMWTADDESTGYPNAADAVASFPAGLTNTVTFTENIICSNVLMNGASTWMTFRSDETQRTFTTPSIANDHGFFANGNDCSFTMDNISIRCSDGIFGAASSSYFHVPGKNGIFRMVNGAKLEYKVGYFNAANATLLLEENADFEIASCYLNPPANSTLNVVISNGFLRGYSSEFPSAGTTTVFFRGDNPQFKPRSMANNRNVVFDFELPAGNYRRIPVLGENPAADMNIGKAVFRVSKKSPALRVGYTNTWQIVSWNQTAANYKNVGIPTNSVTWSGLRSVDFYSFAWRTTGSSAQDPAVANPPYMYLTLGPKAGMAIVFK